MILNVIVTRSICNQCFIAIEQIVGHYAVRVVRRIPNNFEGTRTDYLKTWWRLFARSFFILEKLKMYILLLII